MSSRFEPIIKSDGFRIRDTWTNHIGYVIYTSQDSLDKALKIANNRYVGYTPDDFSKRFTDKKGREYSISFFRPFSRTYVDEQENN